MRSILVLLALGVASSAAADPLPIRAPPCTIEREQRSGAQCQRCLVQAHEGELSCATLAAQHLTYRCGGADPREYKIYCSTPPPRRPQRLDKSWAAGALLLPLAAIVFWRRRRTPR